MKSIEFRGFLYRAKAPGLTGRVTSRQAGWADARWRYRMDAWDDVRIKLLTHLGMNSGKMKRFDHFNIITTIE